MNFRRFIFALLAAGALPAAAAKPDETSLVNAIEQLTKTGSYTWHTELRSSLLPSAITMEGVWNGSETLVKVTSGSQVIHLASRDKDVVASIDNEWRAATKFTRNDSSHTIIRALKELALPHEDMARAREDWQPFRKNTASFFEGEIPVGKARKLIDTTKGLTGQVQLLKLACTECKTTVTLSGRLMERVVTEFQFSTPGLLNGGKSSSLVATTTFSSVGNTKVVLPPEAKAALQAVKKP